MAAKIAYIMSRFPHLPETFILREMNAVEQLGWDIALYPLIKQQQAVIHTEAQSWISRANYTPYLSLPIINANVKMVFQKPGLYFKTLRKVFVENRSKLGFLFRSLILFPKACYLSETMLAEGISHIHAHYATYPALVAWIIHQFSGIKYSVTVHAHDIFVSQAMLATKLGDSAFIVAISEFNRKFLRDHVDLSLPKKTQVIHCGINPELYRAEKENEQFGANQRFEIINVSSLQPYKGQIVLLKACALLKKREIDFRCRIIGEGEERKRLEKFIDQNQLQNQVELLGAQSQDQVARLLPKAHCYVQSSVITLSGKMEGIPVSIMEALASELPVVATEISGIPEIIKSGETGYLVPPENPIALADAIMSVMNNWNQAKKYARFGRALVVEEFDLNKNTALLASCFSKI